jgi:hypothetical protein
VLGKRRNGGKIMGIKTLIAAALVNVAVVGSSLLGQEVARVSIDPQTVLGPVNRLVLGSNVSCLPGDDEWSHSANTGMGAWNPAAGTVRGDFGRDYIEAAQVLNDRRRTPYALNGGVSYF